MKPISVIAAAVIFTGTMLCSCTNKKTPEYRYNHAVELMNSGKYAEAANEFDSLNGYQDSAALKRQANVKLLQSGNVSVGDIIEFGDYKGSKTWRVLCVNDSEALLITENVVDHYMFNKSNNSWNDDRCAIRLWLNDTFINEAFIDVERRMLENRIGDEVFLLSIEEAYRYFKDDADRFLPDDEDNFGWWLRSEGAYSDHAACVDSHYYYSGHISDEGGLVYVQRGVRPAVWIKRNENGTLDRKETVSESGDFVLLQTGSENELIGLTEKGKKQEKLVIPADIQLFGDIVGSSAKSVSFESDADIDYGYFFTRAFRLETLILPAKLTHLGLHSNCPHLKELEVPEGVTVIPVCCFQNDTALETITFKGNLTEIGNLAFVKCSALNNIRLPDSVERIGIGAFGDCSSLREITLPRNLKEIDEKAFANIGLETVIVPAELELEKWDDTAFDQSNKTYIVKVKEGSWADTHFDEVFTGNAIKEYDT